MKIFLTPKPLYCQRKTLKICQLKNHKKNHIAPKSVRII